MWITDYVHAAVCNQLAEKSVLRSLLSIWVIRQDVIRIKLRRHEVLTSCCLTVDGFILITALLLSPNDPWFPHDIGIGRASSET